ncbi:hypothetical protein QO002_005989 [Pararhizobium capsulatum DSM 1112]|uniref:Uncharacterized protein n=1 Tax=Pararhizobium capsulatum DSM 1112 TaxID=1121113 RepID=A0ABU0C3X4_9HYPH|nr:hypothetical protein [Pararhizobium capsulatum DSM 1112]
MIELATFCCAYLEYRIRQPVGADLADERFDTPVTMQRFALRGTPSSILIGRGGSIMHQTFGVEEDLVVGARIAMALSARIPEVATATAVQDQNECVDGRCEVPRAAAHSF